MNTDVHICPILMRTVIWKDGECQEDCDEEDCPLTAEMDYEEREGRD